MTDDLEREAAYSHGYGDGKRDATPSISVVEAVRLDTMARLRDLVAEAIREAILGPSADPIPTESEVQAAVDAVMALLDPRR